MCAGTPRLSAADREHQRMEVKGRMAGLELLVAERARTTALYASAGADTKILVFTEPNFLAERGVGIVGNISTYVLLDSNQTLLAEKGGLKFSDSRTTITSRLTERGSLWGFDAGLFEVTVVTERGTRVCEVVRVSVSNEQFAPTAAAHSWVPKVFVGVTDGCRFGGNDNCVNRLDLGGLSAAAVRRVSLPSWWITDHFADAVVPDTLPVGGRVESRDSRFPACFQKLALLSTDWGAYGGHGSTAIGGATVFSVVPR